MPTETSCCIQTVSAGPIGPFAAGKRGIWGGILTAVPAAFVIVMTFWALIANQEMSMALGNVLLQVIDVVVLIIAFRVVVEGVLRSSAVKWGTSTPAAAPK